MSRMPHLMIAVALGVMIALQPGLNADVARRLGTPVGAAFLSISISFTLCAAYVLFTRQGFAIAALPSLPWYLWFGGVIGFLFVVGGLFVAPVLGGALLFAAIVLGQMIASVVADYFGVGAYAARELDPLRIAGVVLVVAGVFLFQRAG
jgi:transporter family-2 protein